MTAKVVLTHFVENGKLNETRAEDCIRMLALPPDVVIARAKEMWQQWNSEKKE